MTAIDHFSAVGAYMIARSLSGRLVFCSGGILAVTDASGCPRIGGQLEQKTFRFRIASTCLE
jgi:hypothetical protein